MAIFGHMGVGHRYCHKSIDDTVGHAETCVNSSLLGRLPAKFFQHRCCNTQPSAKFTSGTVSCSPLYLFDLEYILFGRGVPYGGGILQLRQY